MPAAAITKTTDGLVFLDTFARANSATVGNNWDESIRGTAAFQIQDNNLDSNVTQDIEQVYQEGHSAAAVVLPTGDTIVQINADMNQSGGDMCRLIVRSDEGEAGTSARDEYFVHFESTTPTLKAVKVINNVEVQTGSDSFNVDNDIRALRLILDDNGGSHVLTAKASEILTNLDDLTKAFTGASVAITDSSSPIEATGDTTDFAILTIDDVWMRHFIMTGRNVVVTGLPDGFKASVDGGTTKVEEVALTATIDIDAVAMPMASVEVYNGSDVLQATLTEDIWGGGIYAFSAFTADLPTLLHGDITGSAAAL